MLVAATTAGMNMPNETYLRLMVWLLASTLLVGAIFTSFPQLDLYASAWFFRDGFWLYELGFTRVVREIFLWFMYAFGLGVGLAFIYALLRRRPLRGLGYGVSLILLGPLLLVNTLLKDNWGRARPIDVTDFGGDSLFTPAYLFTDQCGKNCSFTSGEGGGIATLAILIGFWAWPHLQRKGRLWLGMALGLMVFIVAGLRVAMGQHFLSDTLLSILFCALVAAVLYRLFYPARAAKTPA